MSRKPLTLPEVADRLGVHYMTVYRYVRTGRLPPSVSGVRGRSILRTSRTWNGPGRDPVRPARRRRAPASSATCRE